MVSVDRQCTSRGFSSSSSSFLEHSKSYSGARNTYLHIQLQISLIGASWYKHHLSRGGHICVCLSCRWDAMLLGIVVGHLYFFLTMKYPQEFGGRTLISTPQFLYVGSVDYMSCATHQFSLSDFCFSRPSPSPLSLPLSPHSTATYISLTKYRLEDLERPLQDCKLGGERGVEGGTTGERVVDDWMTRDTGFSFV